MFANRNLENSNGYAFRVPRTIAENERYMHDSTDAVLKKYSRATKFQKTAKFTGGIWDINDTDMRDVAQSNEQDPADFLLSIISDGNDEKMEEENDTVKNSLNLVPEISNVFKTEDESSMKNKRWRTEEFEDKTMLMPDKERNKDIYRKRSKKTAAFSNSPVKNETSEIKRGSIANKSFQLEHVSTTDVSFEMKEASYIMKVVDKRNNKSDDWKSLISQSNGKEPVNSTKDPLLHIKMDDSFKRSQLSSEEVVSVQVQNHQKGQEITVRPQKSNALCTTAVLKEVTNHLYPENNAIEFSDFEETSEISSLNVLEKAEDKKTRNRVTEGCNSVLMNTLKTSGQVGINSVPENSSKKDSVVGMAMPLDKSKCAKSVTNSKVKNNLLDSTILKNVQELLEDVGFLRKEKINVNPKITKLVKGDINNTISVNKNKDDFKKSGKDPTIKSEQLQEVFTSEEQCSYDGGKPSEDESYLRKLKHTKKKVESISQTIEVPSVFDDVIKPKAETKKIKQVSATFSSDKMTSDLNESHSSNLCSSPENHTASFNWRDDCINVRQSSNKLNNNCLKTSTSESFNWRDHCIGFKKSEKEHKQDFLMRRKERYGELNDHKDFSYLDETNDNMESLDYEKLRRRLLKNAKKVKAPDPLSRFQGIGNPDPESIWDSPSECKASSQNQKDSGQNEYFKTNVTTEKIHTQSNDTKKIKIPNFFGTPTKTYSKQSLKIDEKNEKLFQRKESNLIPHDGEYKSNDFRSSRSRKENHVSSKTYGRSSLVSANWRNSYCDYTDTIITVTVSDKKYNVVEEIKIREDKLFELKKEIKKLFHIIPDPDEIDRCVDYSAYAVKIFLRCLFSSSYTLPNWKIVLETYAIAKKFDVHDLQKKCQEYFSNQNLPVKLVDEIAKAAKHFSVVEALQSAEIFPEVERSAKNLDHSSTRNESCIVSCTTYIEPSEFCIPLQYEEYQGIEGTNNCYLRNSIKFECVSGIIHVMGIQLKLQAKDAFSKNKELFICCEVDKNGSKVFDAPDICKQIHTPLIIPFEKRLILKAGDELKINVEIDDISLRMCSQLEDENFLLHGKFHATFKSNKKALFFIEKLIYTFKKC